MNCLANIDAGLATKHTPTTKLLQIVLAKKCAGLSGVKKIINPAPSSARVRVWWWLTPWRNLMHDSQHNRAPGPPFVIVLKARKKLLNKTSNF